MKHKFLVFISLCALQRHSVNLRDPLSFTQIGIIELAADGLFKKCTPGLGREE